MQLGSLYTSHQHTINLAAGDESYSLPVFKNTKNLILKALKRVFKKQKQVVDPDLWKATYQTLEHAIEKGSASVQYNKPNFKLTKQLRESAALFAAKKSWAQATELAAIASSKEGTQISWKEFLEKAKPIIGDYNQRWLKAEFNTAIRAARQASLWTEYEANAHLYPNLRYMASRAATPREEHKPFYGIVRPINDDFWVKHLPPSEWNCLCGVEQTDDDETPLPANGPQPAKGLDNNPGLTGKLFSDSHPYAEAAQATGNVIQIEAAGLDLKRQYEYGILKQESEFTKALQNVKDLHKDFPFLDIEELAAVKLYTGSGYFDLNKAKRLKIESPYHSAFGDVLVRALDKMPNWSGTVFRATNLDQDTIGVYEKASLTGGQVEHPYFTSTSKVSDSGFKGNALYVIETQQGKDVEAISYFQDEREVLLNAESKFEVLEVEKTSINVKIKLRQIL